MVNAVRFAEARRLGKGRQLAPAGRGWWSRRLRSRVWQSRGDRPRSRQSSISEELYLILSHEYPFDLL